MRKETAALLKRHEDLLKEGAFEQLFHTLGAEILTGRNVITADLVKSLDEAGVHWLNFNCIPEGSYFASDIKQFVVPTGVTHIYDSAFEGSSLENVSLPDSLSYIGALAFSRTPLESISIPPFVNIIGQAAFTNTNIESLNIQSSSGLAIQGAAFYANSKLREVTIEGDVFFRIGSEAFSHCTSLNKVVIGSKLKYLGKAAFHSCPLEEIEFKGTKAKWLESVGRSWNMGSKSWNVGASVKVVKCSDGEIYYADETY